MNFVTKVKTHLGHYKLDNFPIRKPGIWWVSRKENKFSEHDHILYKEEDQEGKYDKYDKDSVYKYNLLPAYRDKLWGCISDRKKGLHAYSHHLNSSQMMCINFFYPFANQNQIKRHLISVIQNHCLEQFKINNPENLRFEFEYESGIDKYNKQRSTNFDLRISNNNINLYFEIKYTEDRFGKCYDKKKSSYQEKYYEKYEGLAKKVIDKKYVSDDIFYDNYQIMRNLVHINNNSYVIFLYHDQNETIMEQAEDARDFLKEEYQNRLICLTWDDLYSEIKKEMKSVFEKDADLEKHFKEFSEKYLKFVNKLRTE